MARVTAGDNIISSVVMVVVEVTSLQLFQSNYYNHRCVIQMSIIRSKPGRGRRRFVSWAMVNVEKGVSNKKGMIDFDA